MQYMKKEGQCQTTESQICWIIEHEDHSIRPDRVLQGQWYRDLDEVHGIYNSSQIDTMSSEAHGIYNSSQTR